MTTTTNPDGPPVHDHDALVHSRRWWTLAVLCLSLMLVTIGNASLNVAIPTLARELDASESQLQWVVAVYSLVFAGLLFSTGALGDRFGRKGTLQLGLLLFIAACVAATTFGHSMTFLIGCRAVMGVGAALIMPSTLSILVNVFPPHERSKAIAVWAGIAGGAGAMGPVASGLLLEHFWYGSVFLINVPICTLALVLGWRLVPRSRDPEQGRLDPVGSVLSVIAIVSLVYGLIEAPERGWAAGTTLVAFGVGAAVLVVFVAWELHHPVPMLDIRFFRNGAFSTGTGGMVLVFMAMFGVMFLMTQYFQLVLGYSAFGAAVRFLPIAPMMMVIAPMTPRLSARFGANRVVALGLTLVGAGLVTFRGISETTGYSRLFVSLAALVCGMALTMSPMTAAIMSAVPARRAGVGSAMNDATRELGAALGVAVMGSIAASKYASAIEGVAPTLPAVLREQAQGSISGALEVAAGQPADVAAEIVHHADVAFISGVHLAVTVGAAFAWVAAVMVLRYLPRTLVHEGAHASAIQSMENALELGIGGVEPVFADQQFPGDPAPRSAPG